MWVPRDTDNIFTFKLYIWHRVLILLEFFCFFKTVPSVLKIKRVKINIYLEKILSLICFYFEKNKGTENVSTIHV